MKKNIVNLTLGILNETNLECDEEILSIIERYDKIRRHFENNIYSNNQILNSDGELIHGFDNDLVRRKAEFKLTGLPFYYKILIENDSQGYLEFPYAFGEKGVKVGNLIRNVSNNTISGFIPAFPTSDPMFKLEALYRKNLNNFFVGNLFVGDQDKIDFLMDYLDFELAEFQIRHPKNELLNVLESEYNNNVMKYSDNFRHTLKSLEDAKISS